MKRFRCDKRLAPQNSESRGCGEPESKWKFSGQYCGNQRFKTLKCIQINLP